MNISIITLENGFVLFGEGRRFFSRSFKQICETIKAIKAERDKYIQ